MHSTMEDIKSPEVFISYQWGKQDEVRGLFNRLTQHGFRCWMDIRRINPGNDLYGKIDEGLRGCKVFIRCVTQRYTHSDNCQKEVKLADSLKIPIIPLVLEKMEWPPKGPMAMVFSGLVYIKCWNEDSIQTDLGEKQFSELILALREFIPDSTDQGMLKNSCDFKTSSNANHDTNADGRGPKESRNVKTVLTQVNEKSLFPMKVDSTPNQNANDKAAIYDRKKNSISNFIKILISDLHSEDIRKCTEATWWIDKELRSEEGVTIINDHLDSLFKAIDVLFRTTQTKFVNKESQPDIIQLYKYIFSVSQQLFENQTLACRATTMDIKIVIRGIIEAILDERLVDMNNAPLMTITTEAMNVLVHTIIKSGNCANITSALLELFHECVKKDASSGRCGEIIRHCILNITGSFSTDINDDVLKRILFNLHKFLSDFPTCTWNKPTDLPLRTVKTLAFTLLKVKREEIFNHLDLIEDVENSELVIYLKKSLKKLNTAQKSTELLPDYRQFIVTKQVIHPTRTDCKTDERCMDSTDESSEKVQSIDETTKPMEVQHMSWNQYILRPFFGLPTCRSLRDYHTDQDDEISFVKGDVIEIIDEKIEKSKSARRDETEPLPDAVKFLDNRPVHRCKHAGGCHPQLPFVTNDELLDKHIPISSDRPYLQHLMLSFGEENLPVDVRAMAKSCDFQTIDQSSDLNAILRNKDFFSKSVKRMNKYLFVVMNKALQKLRCSTIPLFRGVTAFLHGSTAENTRVAEQWDIVIFLPLISISEYHQHFPIKTNNLQFELEGSNNIKSMLKQYLMETDDYTCSDTEQWTVHTMLGKCVAKILQSVMEETQFKYATKRHDKMKGMTLKRMCCRHTAVVLTFGYETYEIKINLTFGIRDETSVPDTGDSNLIKPLREQPLYGFYILNQQDVFSSTCTFDEIFYMQDVPPTMTCVYIAAKCLIEICLPVYTRKCGCKRSLFPSYQLKLIFFHMTKYYRDSEWWQRYQWGNRVLEMFVVYSLCLRFGVINNILSGPSSPPVSGINTVITVCSDPHREMDNFILDDDWERFVYNFLTCTGSRHVVEYLKLPRYKYQCRLSCANLVAKVCFVLVHLKQSTSRGDETEVLYDRLHRHPDKVADLVWKEANSKHTGKDFTVAEDPHTSLVKCTPTMPSLNMRGLLANVPKRNETYLRYIIGSCPDANIAQTLRDITSNCGVGETDKSSKLALAIEKLKPHCNVMYTGKAREVEHRVIEGVNKTLHALREVHKRTFRGVTAILLGSSAEKTKTHLPDEWDFVVFIPLLYEVRQNLFPMQRELKDGESVFTRLYRSRLSEEDLKKSVLDHVRTEGEKEDYNFIQHWVDIMLKKFISDLLRSAIKGFTFKQACYEHTATALTFASDSLEIKIDLSIGVRDESSVPVTNDAMLVRPLDEQPEYGFYILRGIYFLPTSTFQELSFMRSLSDNKRLCYQIAKCFIERCIPSTGGYLACECVKPVFPSFYLKLILFHMCKHYEEESDWSEDQFSSRILEMYIVYCSCLTTGVLDVYKPPMQQTREESKRIRERHMWPVKKDLALFHSSTEASVAKCSQRLSDLTDSHEITLDFIDYLREQLKAGTVIPKLELIKAFCILLCRLKTKVP